MVNLSNSPASARGAGRPLRVGYVPLVDCAPLAVAAAEGIFTRHGVRVHLSPEPGWASIREKMIYHKLDAAQCLAGLALALHYGLGCLPQPLVVPLIINANGNAITLSKNIPATLLNERGGLKKHFATTRGGRPFTVATVLPFSSHYILLCDWLIREGFRPDQDADIVYFPPAVIPRNLAAGAIDGYCVGEPWNSLAIENGTGWSPATSVDLADGHPEKVLAVCEWAHRERAEDMQSLTAAVLEACRLCDDPDYRGELAALLARPEWLGVPVKVIRNSLSGSFNAGLGARRTLPHLHRFFGAQVNAPTIEHADWIIAGLRQAGLLEGVRLPALHNLFRLDLYEAALAALPAPAPAVATA